MSEFEDEESRTIFCANISDKVTEGLLYELFLQVERSKFNFFFTCFHLEKFQGGPLEKVAQPKDKDGRARTFAFITYVSFCSR